MIYFMTVHGTLLTRGEDGALGHTPLRDITDTGQLFGIDLPVESVRRDEQDWLERRTRPALAVNAGDLGACSIHVDTGRNLVSIEQDGSFFSAGREGGVTTWTANQPGRWETFLPLLQTELGRIVAFFSGSWIVRSTGAIVRGWQVDLLADFILRVGPLDLPLPRNLPFDADRWPYRITVLVDGWRIEELCLFKPMIYYAAFRSPAVQAQLVLSLNSLLEFGRFDGHIHLLTDFSADNILRLVPGLDRDKLTIQPLSPNDFTGYVAAKYAILDHPPTWQFQPVLFLDPDVVANASLREMLVAIATSDRLTAPIERVGPMRTWPSVGASLIQRDGYDPRFADGFNAGTIGIPNLATHARTLRLIRRIIQNILDSDGRDALRWVDQEVANYASFRLAHVDTASISRFVRYGSFHDAETPGVLSGLVHFWNTGKNDRHQIMLRYIEVLRAHARAGHHLD